MQRVSLTSDSNTLSPTFSRIIAGCMRLGVWGPTFSTQEYLTFIEGCMEVGITSFDHADIYGHYTTEADFGKALKGRSRLRNSIELITKCGINLVCDQRPHHALKSYDTSKEHIIRSVEHSLRAFHTDYLDVLLIHRPDPLLDIEEVASAFETLHKSGKVRSFGVSNFTPSQFSALHSAYPLVTNQIECSITAVEPFVNGTLDQAQEYGLKPMAWSPLGGGRLFASELGEREQRIVSAAHPLLEKYGVDLDVLLLNWILLHPSTILPVLGSTNIARIQKSVKALNFSLSRQDWFSLYEASRGYAVP